MKTLASLFRKKKIAIAKADDFYSSTMMRNYFERKFQEMTGSSLVESGFSSLDPIDALKYAYFMKEEVVMLPKDLLQDLETMDEKRVNEHLNKPESPNGGNRINFNSLEDIIGMQQSMNQLMNTQMQNQQFFASALGMTQARRGFVQNW